MLRIEIGITQNADGNGMGIQVQRVGHNASEGEIKIADNISEALVCFLEKKLIPELRAKGAIVAEGSTVEEAMETCLRETDKSLS